MIGLFMSLLALTLSILWWMSTDDWTIPLITCAGIVFGWAVFSDFSPKKACDCPEPKPAISSTPSNFQ